MVQFFNDIISCYGKFTQFLFEYTPPGLNVPYGYLILACMVFIIVVDYILRSIR